MDVRLDSQASPSAVASRISHVRIRSPPISYTDRGPRRPAAVQQSRQHANRWPQVRGRALRPRQSLHQSDRASAPEDAQLSPRWHRHGHAVEGRGMAEEVRFVRQVCLRLSEHGADGVEPGHRHRLRGDAERAAHGTHTRRRCRRQTRVLREAVRDFRRARATNDRCRARRPARCWAWVTARSSTPTISSA